MTLDWQSPGSDKKTTGRTPGQGDWPIVRPVGVVQTTASSLPGLDVCKMYFFTEQLLVA